MLRRKQVPQGCTTNILGMGNAIGKGIYFPDIGIKNGINLHNFGKGTVPIFKIFL